MTTEVKTNKCPKCGGKAYVQGTHAKGNTKYRYRVCNVCGFRFRTKVTEVFCICFPYSENVPK